MTPSGIKINIASAKPGNATRPSFSDSQSRFFAPRPILQQGPFLLCDKRRMKNARQELSLIMTSEFILEPEEAFPFPHMFAWEIGIISKNGFTNSRVANHLEIMLENTHEDSFRKLLLILVFCLDWSFKVLFDLIKSLSEISNCLHMLICRIAERH